MKRKKYNLVQVDDYAKYISSKKIQEIKHKAAPLLDRHITNINSTYYGGGVAELLGSLSLLFNSLGIKTGWRIIQGSPDFFNVTKKMHNALQGGEINLTRRKKDIYERVIFENVQRNHIDHDLVIIHDPQPLAMIKHYKKHGPWIWRCHLDLSNPNKKLWRYMKDFVEKYDAVVFSIEDYRQKLDTPQQIIMPAIDPFSIKNKEMSKKEIDERLRHYKIPTDLPLIVQVSRFDKYKDPEGVIEAFKIARRKVDATLVLLGNVATDDPEGGEMFKSLLDQREERIIILSQEDTALVNALQTRADIVLQKSIREGFGLTVAEAMWKGTAVIAGNVGGIKHQIQHGENGILVSSVEETAEKIIELLKNKRLRKKIEKNAKESVRKKFLMIRLLEDYLDLINSFQTIYKL